MGHLFFFRELQLLQIGRRLQSMSAPFLEIGLT